MHLAGAGGGGVAGENLFQQRGAGSRHADDEDWQVGRAAVVIRGCHVGLREKRNDLVMLAGEGRAVERVVDGAQCVGVLQFGRGFGVVAGMVERPGQGEMQLYSLREGSVLRGCRAHAGDEGGVRAAAGLHEVVVEADEFGTARDRLFEFGGGGGEIAAGAQYVGEMAARRRGIGLAGEHLTQKRLGFVDIVVDQRGAGGIHQCGRAAGRE